MFIAENKSLMCWKIRKQNKEEEEPGGCYLQEVTTPTSTGERKEGSSVGRARTHSVLCCGRLFSRLNCQGQGMGAWANAGALKEKGPPACAEATEA